MPTKKSAPAEAARSKELPPTVLAAVVLLALVAGLAIAGWWAFGLVRHVEEFGQASDSFGYLESAADLRAGKSPGGGEAFTADSANARLLVEQFKSHGVPVEKWAGAVGPEAYHYMPRSGKIVNQYPPGVGRLLALWPAGQALRDMYAVTFGVIALAAIAMAAWAWWQVKRTGSLVPLAGAAVAFLALQAAVNVLATTVSYSVDYFVLVALPAVGFAAWSGHVRRGWVGVGLALLAGAAAGYAVQMRVAAVLLAPGLGLLVWASSCGDRRVSSRIRRVLAWGAGVLAVGVAPLLVHQARLTGSAFVPTYAGVDAAPPSVGVIGSNLAHYFAGEGALLNWTLYTAVAVAALTAVALRRGGERGRAPMGQGWMAAGVLLVVPTAYFLTHAMVTAYYQFPTIETTVLALAAMLMIAVRACGRWERVVVAGALAATAVQVAAAVIAPRPLFAAEGPARTYAVPAGMEGAHAWVFAERYSGTLWWARGIDAMNLMSADAATRAVAWELVAARARAGDGVFVVDDRPRAEVQAREHPLVREAEGMGARAERAGEFEGAEVWRVAFDK